MGLGLDKIKEHGSQLERLVDGRDVGSAEETLRTDVQSVWLEKGLIESRPITSSFHLSLRTNIPPV